MAELFDAPRVRAALDQFQAEAVANGLTREDAATFAALQVKARLDWLIGRWRDAAEHIPGEIESGAKQP